MRFSIYLFFIYVWFLPSTVLTEEVGALRDGELIAGWDLQRSHHIDLGALPLIHSGRFSVVDFKIPDRGCNMSQFAPAQRFKMLF